MLIKDLFWHSKPLGQILIDLGIISIYDLRNLLRLQKRLLQKNKKVPLGKLLIKKNLISREEFKRAFAQSLNIKFLERNKLKHRTDCLKGDYCVKNNLLVIEMDETIIHLATSNPFNFRVISQVCVETGRAARIYLAEKEAIQEVLRESYPSLSKEVDLWEKGNGYDSENYISIGGIHERENIYFVEPLKKLEEYLLTNKGEDAVEHLVFWHLLKAIEAGASDIHFEPMGGLLRIRHRIDGILYEFRENQITADLAPAIIGRLKVMSKMSIDEKQKPQDGRILLIPKEKRERKYDFRVASSPTINGEEIVLRLLDNRKLEVGYDGLGIIGYPQKMIKEAIGKPYGLIIITGPTGSGKTTTLYTILKELNNENRKIMTVEDPVEYRIPGIMQHQIREKADFRFADAVRAFLRHDPDIILVGEIRDKETAEASMWAALTGHLVLTTLHTNDATSSLTRLLQMGIEPYLICSTIILVLSQRLVRKLCPSCRIKKPFTYDYLKRLGFIKNEMSSDNLKIELYASFFESDSKEKRRRICRSCKGKGFSDRIAIVESMVMTEKIKDAISKGFSASEIRKIAISEGMITMREDGFVKAFHGLTSLQEIISATMGEVV